MCIRPRLLLLLALPALFCMTGCGVDSLATSSSGSMQIRGQVFGGQQPVSGSNIYLYAAGTGGNGTAATSMLLLPRQTDSGGNFNLSADYVCTNAEDQVYLVAQGGNPGLGGTINNAALVMMSALGRCADLPTTQYVSINELTTVAAVWSLAPFINSYSQIAASSTNAAGLKNGFLNSKLLVDPTLGGLAQLPANLSTETGKLYALANALASCINSDGTSACSALFAAATPAGGNAPTNTLNAALNVVRNPGNNVTDVFNTISTFAPFPTTLATAPSDWTMSLTITGGGLNAPTALSVDGLGNVWVAGYYGILSGFSPQGTPISNTGYGAGTLGESYGMTVDRDNNIWVTIEEQPSHSSVRGSVAKFLGVGSGNTGSLVGRFYDNSIDYPVAVAADTNGNIITANYANSSSTVFSSSGGTVTSFLATGNAAFPVAVAPDASHGVWLANQGDRTITHVAADGTILARPSCCNGANGLAVDAFGNAWVSSYYGTSVSEVSAAGTTTLSGIQTGGISYPSGIVIDAAQDVWVANYRGTSFTHLAGNGGSVAAGTALSPSSGFGQDASILLPYGIAVDATGNVWVSNFANNDIVMFFGMASPTKTPVTPVPSAP